MNMTVDQAFNEVLKKGRITLRRLASNEITSLDFFKYAGFKGYVADVEEDTYKSGGSRLIVTMEEREIYDFNMENKQLLKCGIPKNSIIKCLHWKQCHIGESGRCEKAIMEN